jgi:two-component system chemotaxis response regulator CheY
MIADDSAYMRDVIKIFLNKVNIEVVAEAQNGKEAVEKYIRHMPDIVVMDFVMDEENGIEAMRNMLKHNPEAKIIITSSIAGQDHIHDAAMAAGAKRVFVKPINKDRFIEYINELISQ